ncbi:class I SAM-dependent methyltransferase [soil metagenome]
MLLADLPPLHDDLTWVTPLSEERAERLVSFLAGGLGASGSRLLDLGCGWGELLLRTLEDAPGATGSGYDLDGGAIAHGNALAAERGLAERVALYTADARTASGPVDAVLCLGSTQIWGPPVEQDQPLDYPAALTALRDLLPRGGRLVYGDGIWSQPPTDAAVAPLSGRLDELVPMVELVELAAAHGFAPVQVHEATLDEWDVFESGFTAGYATWLATHPADHPHAEAVRERAASQRAAYFGGYRGVLGMAYLCLLAV